MIKYKIKNVEGEHQNTILFWIDIKNPFRINLKLHLLFEKKLLQISVYH
jgi:hypothetical protein